jgi:asparagine synthase (glutamine-hydrolysing)
MPDPQGRYWLTFNGEIYNYLELRRELEADYSFRSRTDAEVIIAAFERWGEACLDRFVGMFAFAIWDEKAKVLFAARDRFGVKPLYFSQLKNGDLILASEIKSLYAGGVDREPDPVTWSTYLSTGLLDYSERTFWKGISSLPPGHTLKWRDGVISVARWYDLAERIGGEIDERPIEVVKKDYYDLLIESVALRFRSDVPVGINLSGGLDSSVLLGLVQAVEGAESDAKAFTFLTGDEQYDELPWVSQMLAVTNHELVPCQITPEDVPALAASVQYYEDEPFGGLPTLAYARLFERARDEGVIVLLDGQGMDEQWAGYDYYDSTVHHSRIVQGTSATALHPPEWLAPEFRGLADPFEWHRPFSDPLRDLQYRDARYSKIPRALRFNDRISMRAGTELREPFLDHRLFEIALRQPRDRKLRGGVHKWLLRQIASGLVPPGVSEAPKRPLQTPQREWLRGPLAGWAHDCIEAGLAGFGSNWMDKDAVRAAYSAFFSGAGDTSFVVWQWISLGLMGMIYRDAWVDTSVSVVA